MRMEGDDLAVEVRERPFAITIERGGRRLLGPVGAWRAEGEVHDRFIQLTEGVLAHEELDAPERLGRVEEIAPGVFRGEGFELRVELHPGRVVIELSAAGARQALHWPSHPGERFVGLGARHNLHFDQSGRSVQLGADRRYTGPDCPPDMLDVGGVPMGDYAPAPWVNSSAGYGLWLETDGEGAKFDLDEPIAVSLRPAAGPLRLHVFTDPTPAGRLRSYQRLTGFPAVLPEWGYGHWKSRDIHWHQRDVEDDFDGYRRENIPLDAIVIDSPWETQYNTWEWNPHQFPDAPGMIEGMRADGVRIVVWVTPWVNRESVDGQMPDDPESRRLHAEPAANYEEGMPHYVRMDGEPYVTKWWMGTGSPIDFTSPPAEAWWREQAKRVLRMGVAGIKADDGEGYYYFPSGIEFSDGRTAAQAAWAYPDLYARSMQRALDEVHPGEGVLFARSGWTGRQSTGHLWGGDQVSDFWSLRVLVAATLNAAASGFSNWSHDVGGYLGKRITERCPKELLLRWVQFGCFSPLFQAHGRFEQEAWTYDAETIDLYRDYVLLHERLVPYIRAAAATAARAGLPIIRPLCLSDPEDEHGWFLPDAYGFGPALWVAPVLEEGARSRAIQLPRGRWIDFWTHERVRGGCEIEAQAPLGQIPAWVREGSLIVTYPAAHVARGLGDTAEGERPLEATLWGEPPLGHAAVRLADGTRIAHRHGEWLLPQGREVVSHSRIG